MPLLRGAACHAHPEVFAATTRTYSAKQRGRTAMRRKRPPPGRSRTRHERQGHRSRRAERRQQTILRRMEECEDQMLNWMRNSSWQGQARHAAGKCSNGFLLKECCCLGVHCHNVFSSWWTCCFVCNQSKRSLRCLQGNKLARQMFRPSRESSRGTGCSQPCKARSTTPLACGNKVWECLESRSIRRSP